MRWLALACVGCACGGDGAPPPPVDVGCEPVAGPLACPGRGVYDAPVEVEMAAPAGTAAIRYTLDGSEPAADSPLYESPIEIAPDAATGGARVLRMLALDADGNPTGAATHTYVFPAQVLDQPAEIPGMPTLWGADPNLTLADYEMDRSALGGADDEAAAALSEIPIVSVVGSHADFWDPDTGIYMRPAATGPDFERPMSLEVIFPDGSGDHSFGIPCGIRIQGASSTIEWRSAKLSLRAAFRSEYGAGQLVYPLFPDSPVARFENLILDAHYNNTYPHLDPVERQRAQYARDQYTSLLQNAVGSLAPHGRPVNLFINGLYWGLYDLHERPDAHFAADHLGGDAADYDVIRHTPTNVVDGSDDSYLAMLDLASADLSKDANVAALAQALDIDDLIDYILVNVYAGNNDWDIHNWYAAARPGGGGYRFISWDAEHVIEDLAQDSMAIDTPGGPTGLFHALLDNAGFRAQVAARAAELFGPGGAFYVDASAPAWDPDNPDRNVPASLYVQLTDEIRGAMLLESARWGDNRRMDEPYTRDDWDAERQRLLEDYFPDRSAVTQGQIPAP